MFKAKTPNGRMAKTVIFIIIVLAALFIVGNVLSFSIDWLLKFYNKLSKDTITAIIAVSIFWNVAWIINNLIHTRNNK